MFHEDSLPLDNVGGPANIKSTEPTRAHISDSRGNELSGHTSRAGRFFSSVFSSIIPWLHSESVARPPTVNSDMAFVTPTELRTRFACAMSDMYRKVRDSFSQEVIDCLIDTIADDWPAFS